MTLLPFGRLVLSCERDKLSTKVARRRVFVVQRNRELQTLKDNAERPPESLVSNLKEGLVAYCPFNGNAKDESGNGDHGTGNVKFRAADRFGKKKNAPNFDGNESLVFSSKFIFHEESDASLCFWFNTQNEGAIFLVDEKKT